MIVVHCDICKKETSVYQALRVTTMTIHSTSPGLPSGPETAYTFDICSGNCFDAALTTIRNLMKSQGIIR